MTDDAEERASAGRPGMGPSSDLAAHAPFAGDHDLLGLEVAEMRALGYWVVDRVIEHLEGLPGGPAIREGSPGELREALGGPVPEEGGSAQDALRTLADVALSHMQHGDHPRYFARVPGPSSYAGVLADWLGTGFNAIAASWGGGSGPATVELVTLDWLRELLGLPSGTEGVMTSGGSLANLTALAAARAAVGPGVCYLSDQTHASIAACAARARLSRRSTCASCLGRALAAAARRTCSPPSRPTRRRAGARGSWSPPRAPRTAAPWTRCRRSPTCAAPTASGSTSTAPTAPRPRCAMPAAGRWPASSVPTRSCSTRTSGSSSPTTRLRVRVAARALCEQAFRMTPDYLADVAGTGGEVNLRDRGLELTRRARGLKLWLTFRTYGLRRLRAAIERGHRCGGARAAARRGRRALGGGHPGAARDRDLRPARLRLRRAQGPRRCAGRGRVSRWLTTTRLRGRPVLRLCTINPRTSAQDIAATLERLGVVVS